MVTFWATFTFCGVGHWSAEACTDCDVGQYRQSTKVDEWTFTISQQDITASAGVAVTQTISDHVVTGILKTALTGAAILLK